MCVYSNITCGNIPCWFLYILACKVDETVSLWKELSRGDIATHFNIIHFLAYFPYKQTTYFVLGSPSIYLIRRHFIYHRNSKNVPNWAPFLKRNETLTLHCSTKKRKVLNCSLQRLLKRFPKPHMTNGN